MVKKLLNDLRKTVKEIKTITAEIDFINDCYKRQPQIYEQHFIKCQNHLNVLILARDGMHKQLIDLIDKSTNLTFPEYMIIIDYYLYANTDQQILNRYNMSERTFYSRKKQAIKKLSDV